jgi:hypothetical protein
MASVINITKTQRRGKYADIVDFADEMAQTFGSSTQAVATLLRRSPEYGRWRRSTVRRQEPRGRRKAG